MKRVLSILLLLAVLSASATSALAANTVQTRLEAGAPVLLADYPADEYAQSFEGEPYDWYREVYSYEDVGVMVTNERQSRFYGGMDEILSVTEAYGTITSAAMVEMEPLEGADLAVHLRFETRAAQGAEGPRKWIVDVVKVYEPNYCFLFTVARDAEGKDYAKKVARLISSLRLGDPEDDIPVVEGNFFADDPEVEEEGKQDG